MHVSIPMSLISRLIPRYAEPHRRYHTWHHIAEVFDASERISNDKSLELTLAILFHDAVYAPLSKTNEEDSARLLQDEGKRAGIGEDVLLDASWLVLQTKHLATAFFTETASSLSRRPRADVLLDSDLSILGSDPKTFDLYEDAIRQEYSMVPDAQFASGRATIMKNFLESPMIFMTDRGRELWEKQARENLKRSLERWKGQIQ